MCGIAGYINISPGSGSTSERIQKMCDVIAHRGPDDSGYFISENQKVCLGQRRLSIIDLLTGHQPMWDSEKSVAIIFNGEIYNFRELKQELIKKGYSFETTSDTEVIIYLYKEYGVSGFKKLNGIFAFAIYDKKKNVVVIARDIFGVKPLYYFADKQKLIFGSEIKSIIVNNEFKREIDLNNLNTFLTYRYNPSAGTLFKNIHKLNPGHYLEYNFDNGNFVINAYYSSSPKTNESIDYDDAVETYKSLLEKSVERQLISDVPVGLLLSGGIDSAVLAILMQKYSPYKIKTFSIGFEGKGRFNELDDARETAELAGSEHYEMLINQNQYVDFFMNSFRYVEEPISEPTIPALYYVSKLASEHLKVIFAGQGADEPLAGYPRYIGEKLLMDYGTAIKLIPFKNLISKYLPRNERIKRGIYSSYFSDEAERFLAIYSIFNKEELSSLLNSDVKQSITDHNLSYIKNLLPFTSGLDNSLSKLLYLDTRLSLPDNLLLFGDKVSMANSLEMRVPFLDIELVNFLETLLSDFKLKNKIRKRIHKDALKAWLPEKIINRPKRGFETPMDEWMRSSLADELKLIVNDKGSVSAMYFNVNYINSLIDLHKSGKENYQRKLFLILSLEVWYKTFFNKIFDSGKILIEN